MDRRDEVIGAATQGLGELRVIADHSWPLGDAVVLAVGLASGEQVIVKGHGEHLRFATEVSAYRDFVPAIADRAPSLIWSDDQAYAIATTRLPGAHANSTAFDMEAERALYRDAATVLRRFQQSQPPVDLPNWADEKLESLEDWIGRAPEGLLGGDDIAFARHEVAVLSQLPAPSGVPRHGDWQPRNWFVSDEGHVHTFDFERAGYDWCWHDLLRMWWNEWNERPDLAEAHFEGYGRSPSDEDLARLRGASARGHIVQIVWATQHNDADFAAAGRRYLESMKASR